MSTRAETPCFWYVVLDDFDQLLLLMSVAPVAK